MLRQGKPALLAWISAKCFWLHGQRTGWTCLQMALAMVLAEEKLDGKGRGDTMEVVCHCFLKRAIPDLGSFRLYWRLPLQAVRSGHPSGCRAGMEPSRRVGEGRRDIEVENSTQQHRAITSRTRRRRRRLLHF